MQLDDLIIKMEQYAKDYNIPIMDKKGLAFLQQVINDNKVVSILELGSAIGYSAIQMAKLNANIHITTIERDESRYNEAIKNIKAANMENQIDIYLADALEFSTDEKFDLIFIDAAKAQYIKFFERYQHNLKSDGVIVSDNLDFHGMVNHTAEIKNRNTRQLVRKIEKYIQYLKDLDGYDTEFIAEGDGIALTKKSCYNQNDER